MKRSTTFFVAVILTLLATACVGQTTASDCSEARIHAERTQNSVVVWRYSEERTSDEVSFKYGGTEAPTPKTEYVPRFGADIERWTLTLPPFGTGDATITVTSGPCQWAIPLAGLKPHNPGIIDPSHGIAGTKTD